MTAIVMLGALLLATCVDMTVLALEPAPLGLFWIDEWYDGESRGVKGGGDRTLELLNAAMFHASVGRRGEAERDARKAVEEAEWWLERGRERDDMRNASSGAGSVSESATNMTEIPTNRTELRANRTGLGKEEAPLLASCWDRFASREWGDRASPWERARAVLGSLLLAQERFDEAVEALLPAACGARGDAATVHLLAEAMWGQGRHMQSVSLQMAVLEWSVREVGREGAAVGGHIGSRAAAPLAPPTSTHAHVSVACLALADSLRLLGRARAASVLYDCAEGRARDALSSDGAGSSLASSPSSSLVALSKAEELKRRVDSADGARALAPRRPIVQDLLVGDTATRPRDGGLKLREWRKELGGAGRAVSRNASRRGDNEERSSPALLRRVLRSAMEGRRLLDEQQTSLLGGVGSLGEPPSSHFEALEEGNAAGSRKGKRDVDKAREAWWRAASAMASGKPMVAASLLQGAVALLLDANRSASAAAVLVGRGAALLACSEDPDQDVDMAERALASFSKARALLSAQLGGGLSGGDSWADAGGGDLRGDGDSGVRTRGRSLRYAHAYIASLLHSGRALVVKGAFQEGITMMQEAADLAREHLGGRRSPLHAAALGALADAKTTAEMKAMMLAGLCSSGDSESVCRLRVLKAATRRTLQHHTVALRRWRAVDVTWRSSSRDFSELGQRHAWMTFVAYEARSLSPLEASVVSLVLEQWESTWKASRRSLFYAVVESVTMAKVWGGQPAAAAQYVEAALAVLMDRVHGVSLGGRGVASDKGDSKVVVEVETAETAKDGAMNETAGPVHGVGETRPLSLAVVDSIARLASVSPLWHRSQAGAELSPSGCALHRLAAPPLSPDDVVGAAQSMCSNHARGGGCDRLLALDDGVACAGSGDLSSRHMEDAHKSLDDRKEATGDSPFCHANRVLDARALYVLLQLRTEDARRAVGAGADPYSGMDPALLESLMGRLND